MQPSRNGLEFRHWPLTFVRVTMASIALTMAMARMGFLRPVVS
ncbi:MAG: hypothetical protein ACOH2J_21605 [Allorhizobium sp.]